jgi:hypothetical protein
MILDHHGKTIVPDPFISPALWAAFQNNFSSRFAYRSRLLDANGREIYWPGGYEKIGDTVEVKTPRRFKSPDAEKSGVPSGAD